MFPLKGRALLAVTTTITSLGFLMIGFDNGLMGGFGQSCVNSPLLGFTHSPLAVNGPQFAASFDNPSATMIGVFVGIYEGLLRCHIAL